MKTVIYGDFFYRLGGIESWVYYVCKRYNKGQITIVYKQCDPEQLERFKKVAECRHLDDNFECDKVIYVAPIYIKDDIVYRNSKKRYLFNHVCYGEAENNEEFQILPLDGIFAVSETCKESCQLKMPYDMKVLYNPIELDEPRKLLKFVSACRWSKDKGSEQMLKFAKMLDDADIPFIWLILTDEIPEEHHPNMFFIKTTYDIATYLMFADYGVQFTRIDAYNNFVNECLSLKIPVILSDIPVFREFGLPAFYYDWDMNGPDVRELLNIPKVDYVVPNSDVDYEELFK